MVQGKIYPPPKPTTPRLAPWDHVEELCSKLDKLIAVLEAWSPTAPPITPPPEWPGWEPVISKLDEIKEQIAALEFTAPWVAKEPEEIFRKAIRATGTLKSDRMANWTQGKRLLLRVDSSLDQAVQIQATGNIGNTVNGAVDINTAQPCAAGGKISIGLAWDDWHPYIGCKITIAIAPTTGILIISAVIQE
jgi:hypothetical protein